MASEKYLIKTKELVLSYLKQFKAKVYLFGSQATGKSRQNSDIDIAIDSTTLPPYFFSRLKTLLEESHIPQKIDLVDLSKTDALFKKRVLKEGIVWKD